MYINIRNTGTASDRQTYISTNTTTTQTDTDTQRDTLVAIDKGDGSGEADEMVEIWMEEWRTK